MREKVEIPCGYRRLRIGQAVKNEDRLWCGNRDGWQPLHYSYKNEASPVGPDEIIIRRVRKVKK